MEYKVDENDTGSVEGIKRKYPEIAEGLQEEWESLLKEIRKTENYLYNLQKKESYFGNATRNVQLILNT